MEKKTNEDMSQNQQNSISRLSLVSIVLGFLSIVLLGAVTGIPAIISGHIVRSRLKGKTEKLRSKRLALAGIILGYSGVFITIIVTVVVFVAIYYPDLLHTLFPYK
jgi:uncharacterized BrkB/YihY/UPF0761 family membrane protein